MIFLLNITRLECASSIPGQGETFALQRAKADFLHLTNFFIRKDKTNNKKFTITTVAPAGKSA